MKLIVKVKKAKIIWEDNQEPKSIYAIIKLIEGTLKQSKCNANPK